MDQRGAGTVAWISVAPVKGLALSQLESIELSHDGVAENRRFFLIDEAGLLVNGKRLGLLVQVASRYEARAEELELRFPDGAVVGGRVALAEAVTTNFYGRAVAGHLVAGPWSEALSAWSGTPLRLVRSDVPGDAADRGSAGGVSLVSTAGLAALARAAGAPDGVDGRRFRMLFGVDGVPAHEEDRWLGRELRIGGTVVALRGNVGRCAVTTQNPETGLPDLDTLGALAQYRATVPTTEPLPFGVWGQVIRPGRVRLGDAVQLR